MNNEIDEFSPRCMDKRCDAKCALYIEAKKPEYRVTAFSLRMNWEPHHLQCRRSREYFGVVLND